MMSLTSSLVYIGATEDTVTGRHCTRNCKLDQLQAGRFISCEIAIRYWHKHRTFWNFFPTIYIATDTKIAALARPRSI